MAGVAKSTVSRYLNGGSVSQKTSMKIEAIIKETGYYPNTFAQSLKARKSKMVGVIIPRLGSFSANRILSQIDQYLRERHYQMLIISSNFNIEREEEALKTFQVNKMDGVIFLMTHTDESIKQMLQSVNVPVVTIGQAHHYHSAIYYNERQAGSELAQYVYQQGHRELDYLTVTTNDPAVGQIRYNAIKEKFLSYGDTVFREYETSFDLIDAYELTKTQVLQHSPKLIVGATDVVTIGAMRAAKEAGLDVPNEISFAGFGNHEMGKSLSPGLTTIEYPYDDAGILAAKTLIKQMENPQQPNICELETSLIIRDSVQQVTGFEEMPLLAKKVQ